MQSMALELLLSYSAVTVSFNRLGLRGQDRPKSHAAMLFPNNFGTKMSGEIICSQSCSARRDKSNYKSVSTLISQGQKEASGQSHVRSHGDPGSSC